MGNWTDDELCWLSATELADKVRKCQISPSEIAQASIARIARINPRINALVYHDPEKVLSDAAALTAALDKGLPLGPLHGVPYTLKEGCAVAGLPTTAGLVPFKSVRAQSDAAVSRRLREAGGLFLGQTNVSEAGYCGGSTNHLFGATHNPWKLGMTAGGSSSGAGAAVAAGLGPLAQGTDGGGSVRIPAAVNGVVGFKPSLGRIPQTALAGRFHTFICHGPIARTVHDAALMLKVMAGPDSSDPLSLPGDVTDYQACIQTDIRDLRIAWSADFGFAQVDPEIVALCAQAAEAFEELGCHVEPIDLDWPDPSEAMWEGVWAPAYASLLAACDWEQWRGQVDEEFLELLDQGARLTVAQINRADAARGALWDRFAALMNEYDLLVTPTLALQTFPVEQFCPRELQGKPLRERLLGWLLTYPYNMLGNPAISVPAGWSAAGLPVGLQIAGGLHADALVVQAAASFERLRPWAHKTPQILNAYSK